MAGACERARCSGCAGVDVDGDAVIKLNGAPPDVSGRGPVGADDYAGWAVNPAGWIRSNGPVR
jgi:hypothetical protein